MSSGSSLRSRDAEGGGVAFFFAGALAMASTKDERARSDEAFEAKITAPLRAEHPGAVASFEAGSRAGRAGDAAKAAREFETTLKAAPDFVPALRRRGGALVQLGDRAEGMKLLRRALELEERARQRARDLDERGETGRRGARRGQAARLPIDPRGARRPLHLAHGLRGRARG